MAVKTSPFENVSELLARFQRAVAENRAGQPVLNRTAFVKLVKEIFIDQGTIAAPSYADLDAAFTLADEDKSSGLDEVEFVKVFELIKQGKIQGLGAKPSMFEAPGAKKSREGAFKAGVTGAAGVRASFQAKATANGVAALTKPLFVALMREVLQEHKLKKKPPTEADLATAFTLADTNNNGVVDEEEFMVLHALVQAGKVAGLGSASRFAGASKQKQQQGEFKEAFAKAGAVLAVGDLVTWVDDDDELPKGVVGKVLRVHDDGDVECLFPMPNGNPSKVFTFAAKDVKRHVPSQYETPGAPPSGAAAASNLSASTSANKQTEAEPSSKPSLSKEATPSKEPPASTTSEAQPSSSTVAETKPTPSSQQPSAGEKKVVAAAKKEPWKPTFFQFCCIVFVILYICKLVAMNVLSKPEKVTQTCGSHLLEQGKKCWR